MNNLCIYVLFEFCLLLSLCRVYANALLIEMPLSTGELHYRIVDVSTVKELAMRLNPAVHERRCEMIKKDLEAEEKGEFVPEGKHTAKYDIYKSIDEMKFYQKHFLITQ